MFYRMLATPLALLAIAALLLNILIIVFGATTDPEWFIALAFTIPLLWASLGEVARHGSSEES